jgi:hypothetical protein
VVREGSLFILRIVGQRSRSQLLKIEQTTTKTGRHDIAEILVKVALNTKNQINAECLVEKQPDYTIQASFCFYSLKLNAYQRSSILQFYSKD